MAKARRKTITYSGGRRTVTRGRSRSHKVWPRWAPSRFFLSWFYGPRRRRRDV
jgi:hypothetical protein